MVTRVVNDREQNAYLLLRDDEELGRAEYRIEGDTIVFTHTVVDRRLRGQGLGSVLARFALGEVRDTTNLRVVAQCSFIAEWIQRHPEFQQLLSDAAPEAFDIETGTACELPPMHAARHMSDQR